jgi:hypothetical protein
VEETSIALDYESGNSIDFDKGGDSAPKPDAGQLGIFTHHLTDNPKALKAP